MSEALRLFLVEDEDDFAFLMRKTLERAGHHVTICHCGADALLVLAHTKFHLIVLDQKLPDMTGLDLLNTMSREGISTPVLMVTGFGTENLATQVLHAGALDYLVKDEALAFLVELPKRAQEAVTRHRLQQTNTLLIEAIESARDGIIITDLHGTIQHVNRALEGMFGYARKDLVGQSPRLFHSGAHESSFFHSMWRTILNRASWQGELVNKRQDGTFIDNSLTISPILDQRGQLTHFVGIYRDITDRKLMERQLFHAQKMQSVGTLAGGVAHEFNNLLAGIQGYATLGLRAPFLAANIREFLEFIVQLSDRAAHLTRQLLAFARKPALRRQPTSMEKLLHDTVELVRNSMKIDVVVKIDPALEAEGESGPPAALADANQLQQVLINLALNARDSLPAGSTEPIVFCLRQVVLTGETSAFPENVPGGDYAVIEVRDQGSGMTPETLAQAFDPFFTTKKIGQGTGLGLPVAFGIMRGHQGFLILETEVGVGTRVHLYLPRLVQATQQPAMEPMPQAQEPERSTGRRILVIDDEEAVLDVISRFLEIAGHKVTGASSGANALDKLTRTNDVDLILLDLMIPREEGETNFRRLRDAAPGVPIILCTGMVQADQLNHLLQVGAADLLRKPFGIDELWRAVDKALAK